MNSNNIFTLQTKLVTVARALGQRQLLLLALLILALAPNSLAQGASDYHRVEVFGGYSLARGTSNVEQLSATSPGGVETFSNLCSSSTGERLGTNSQKFFCERRNYHGFDASVTFNLTRYFGLKADITGHYKSESFADVFPTPFGDATQTIDTRERVHQFLFGVQVKDNGVERRLKPFGHALVGAARYNNRQRQEIDLFPDFNFLVEDRETSLAMKLGGGLDVRVSRRIDLRVFEIDYNPIYAGDRTYKTISGPFTLDAMGKTAHNYTFSFGIVIH
ncbi:MAG: hypothetical protein ACJ74G_07585 [Blastocatellia bacterium]